MPTHLFIHSPALGPQSVSGVAGAMGGLVADTQAFVHADPPLWRAFVDLAVAQTGEAVGAVIGHSGAGSMLPVIAHRLGAEALVFVDAVLPPTRGHYDTPASLLSFLTERAHDGLLLPWADWWEPEVLARALPDRSHIDKAAGPQVPLSFYGESVPVPPGWSELPCAYLRLSAAYDDELQRAARQSWPTRQMSAGHLATITHPDVVADALGELIGQL